MQNSYQLKSDKCASPVEPPITGKSAAVFIPHCEELHSGRLTDVLDCLGPLVPFNLEYHCVAIEATPMPSDNIVNNK